MTTERTEQTGSRHESAFAPGRFKRSESAGDAGLFILGGELRRMKSTRKGLRNDDLYKDTYGRLNCAECEKTLATENAPDEVYNVRRCPDCEREFRELP